jgi:uncharacterized protein (DUF433 family)
MSLSKLQLLWRASKRAFPIQTLTGYDELRGVNLWHRQLPIQRSTGWPANLIEQVPGKVSGRPVVRGTRIFPDAILNSYELGDTVESIHEGFPSLTLAQIERLIAFGLDQLRQSE